jgi:hypothetical protein
MSTINIHQWNPFFIPHLAYQDKRVDLTRDSLAAVYASACDQCLDDLRWICLGFAMEELQKGGYRLSNELPYDFRRVAEDAATQKLKLSLSSGLQTIHFSSESTGDFDSLLRLDRFLTVESIYIDGFLPRSERVCIDKLSSLKKLSCKNSDIIWISIESVNDIFCENCPKLESIIARSQKFEIRNCPVTDLVLENAEEFIAINCSNITSLQLPKARKVTLDNCPLLTILNVPVATEISGRQLPRLTDVSSSKPTQVSFSDCRNLQTLDLSQAKHIFLEHVKMQQADAPLAIDLELVGLIPLVSIYAPHAEKVFFSNCSIDDWTIPKAKYIRIVECNVNMPIVFFEAIDFFIEKIFRAKCVTLPKARNVECIECESLSRVEAPNATDVSIRRCALDKAYFPSALTVSLEELSLKILLVPKATQVTSKKCRIDAVDAPQATEVCFEECSSLYSASFCKARNAYFSSCDTLHFLCLPLAYRVTCEKNRSLKLLYAPKARSPNIVDCHQLDTINDHLLSAAKEGDLKLCAMALHLGADETVVDKKNHPPFFYLSSEQRTTLTQLRMTFATLIQKLALSPAEVLASRVVVLNKSLLNENMAKLASTEGIVEIFSELYKIPGIKPLMEYAKLAALGLHLQKESQPGDEEMLTICFDAKKTTVEGIQFWGKDGLDGMAASGCYTTGGNKICIAAKTTSTNTPQDIYATIIHELTHFIAYHLFHNDCNPYPDYLGGRAKAFDTIASSIKADLSTKDTIFQNVFNTQKYKVKEIHKELIVRVPEMMVTYPGQDGMSRLEQQVPELLEYYFTIFLREVKEAIVENEKWALNYWPKDLFFLSDGIIDLENEFCQLQV